MLKALREGAKSTLLKTILFGMLLMAMFGLAVMDVQGLFRSGIKNGTLVNFGRVKLSATEFDQILQANLHEENMKQSEAYATGIPQQLLKQQISNRLYAMTTNDIGIQISDKIVVTKVRELLASIVKRGVSEKDALQQVLQIFGTRENQLVATLKSEMAIDLLLGSLTANTHAPSLLIDEAVRYSRESRRGEYFRLTFDDIASVKPSTDSELKAYYDTIARQYSLPEHRTLSVLLLDKSMLGDAIRIPEEKLKQHYDENISDYAVPETRVIPQAIADDETVAKQVYEEALRTKDLKKAAENAGREFASYVQAGNFTESTMQAETAKPAFSAKEGDILAPIKSPMGWHILTIEKVIPAIDKPFDAVKAGIEKELMQDKAAEALYERANAIEDEIAGGKSLSEVARENNLKETVLEKITAHGMTSAGKKPDVTIPLYDKAVENGFDLKEGEASPLIETPDGGFMLVGVKEIVPSEQQPFDKVQDDVAVRWKKDAQTKALSEKANALLMRLNQGENFAKIARELGKTVQPTELIERGTTAEKAKILEPVLNTLFSIERQGYSNTASGDGDVAFVRFSERKITLPKEIKKEDTAGTEAVLARHFRQDILEQYRAYLIRRYDVSINDKLMDEMYPAKPAAADGEE
jgi:peptidyl-prolyl cis-trans isomerase D